MEMGLPSLETWRRKVDDLARGVNVTLVNRVSLTRSQVEGLGHRLRALDPVATLNRGFSVVQNASSGQVVSSTAQVATGDALTITLSDGLIPATAGSGPRAKTGRKRRPATEGDLMERLL
jgi:exodeoxyribonuclease VII large subunit